MTDDIRVDLGEIPLDHAKTLLICVMDSLDSGRWSDTEWYQRAVSLKALLTYRIAKAEKTQTFCEPG